MTEPTPGQPEEPLPQQPVPAGGLTSDERNWGMAAHLSSLSGFVIPLGNIIGPLVVWLIKREQYPYVDAQGKEAVNFNISILIYGIVSAILILLLVGILLIIAVLIAWLVLTIVAAVKAANGEGYRYPLTIRFIS
jgi:uncharacterized protein